MYNRWHIYARGHLPDGRRIFIATISRDYSSRLGFAAVLVCDPGGLRRLWKNSREDMLSAGFVWPNNDDWSEDERSLRKIVPKHWGSQGGSSCVIKEIPVRILRSKTDNLARLLLAWRASKRKQFSFDCQSLWIKKDGSYLPIAHPWKPTVITVIPNTDMVVRALRLGALQDHLESGLERIYISERVSLCAPSHRAALFDLAEQFSERLIIVPMSNFFSARFLDITRPYAQEYCDVGGWLADRYKKDFGYDKWENPRALDPFFRIRIGEVPRGIQLMPLHEKPISFELWAKFRKEDISVMKAETAVALAAREAHGIEFLRECLKNNEANND